MLLLGVGEHVTQHCLDLVGTILCVLILVLLREADLGVLFVETSVPWQEHFRDLLLNGKAQTVVYDAKLLVQLGNLYLDPEREIVSSRDYGFESDVYKGGKFSNQSSRKSGDKATGQEVKTRDVRNDRPSGLRKVVGEAVVLNVKERTATVVITRTAQEIHTGDWVEIQ